MRYYAKVIRPGGLRPYRLLTKRGDELNRWPVTNGPGVLASDFATAREARAAVTDLCDPDFVLVTRWSDAADLEEKFSK